MTVANPDGSIEIHPGPRGHSVVSVGVTDDGAAARFTTDEPRALNPIPLPRGPQGKKGETGNPGRAAIRVETPDAGGEAGYRVFQWDPTLQAEQLVYGDTGVLDLGAGRLVRRVGTTVELEGSVDGLPAGFRPAMPQPGTVHKLYTTADPWPEDLRPWTVITPPTPMYGLQAYDADRASGYPGTADEWLSSIYRTILPPAGSPGQVLTRTASGSTWEAPRSYGPEPWVNVTLAAGWAASSYHGAPQVRLSAGTVEMIGGAQYTGAVTEVGLYSDQYLKVGNLPPGMVPDNALDTPVRSYRYVPGGRGIPIMARLDITEAGAIRLAAFGDDTTSLKGFTAGPGATTVAFTNTAWPLRNSSN